MFVQDAVVPRTELERLLPEIERIAREHGLRLANFFRGRGNLHPNLLFDRRDASEVERVERAGAEIMRLCVAAGGTITGEHGVGSDCSIHAPDVPGSRIRRRIGCMRRLTRNGANRRCCRRPAPGVRLDESPRGLHSDHRDRAVQLAPVPQGGSRAGYNRAGNPDPDSALPVQVGHPDSPFASTSRLAEVASFRPRDLTIEVGAGLRLQRLRELVEENGLWIPAAGIGAARSIGGWIAASSPAVWDAAYGPVRRQLLGCMVTAPDGRELTLGPSRYEERRGI